MKKTFGLVALAAACLVSNFAFGAYANIWVDHPYTDPIENTTGGTLSFAVAMNAFVVDAFGQPTQATGPLASFQGFILYGHIEKWTGTEWQRQFSWQEPVYNLSDGPPIEVVTTIDHTGFDDGKAQFQLKWSDIHPDMWNFYGGHSASPWPEHGPIPGGYDPAVAPLGETPGAHSHWVHFEKRINEQGLLAYTVYPASTQREPPGATTPVNPGYEGSLALFTFDFTADAEEGLYRFAVASQWVDYAGELNTKSGISTGSETTYTPMGRMQYFGVPPFVPFNWYVTETLNFGQYMGGDPLNPASFDYTTGEFYIKAGEIIIPEPTTMVLLGIGLAGLASIRRRK